MRALILFLLAVCLTATASAQTNLGGMAIQVTAPVSSGSSGSSCVSTNAPSLVFITSSGTTAISAGYCYASITAIGPGGGAQGITTGGTGGGSGGSNIWCTYALNLNSASLVAVVGTGVSAANGSGPTTVTLGALTMSAPAGLFSNTGTGAAQPAIGTANDNTHCTGHQGGAGSANIFNGIGSSGGGAAGETSDGGAGKVAAAGFAGSGGQPDGSASGNDAGGAGGGFGVPGGPFLDLLSDGRVTNPLNSSVGPQTPAYTSGGCIAGGAFGGGASAGSTANASCKGGDGGIVLRLSSLIPSNDNAVAQAA